MEPVYCPNGHPNRPGTRICIVCRALLPPSTPATSPRKQPGAPLAARPQPPSPPQLSPPPPADGEPPSPPAPARRQRTRLWVLLLLAIVAVGLAAVLLSLSPVMRAITRAPAPTAGARVAVAAQPATRPADAATALPTVAPTAPPSPTATLPPLPTAVATITPPTTIVGVVITPTLAFGPDINYIQNGNFADDWVNGWAREGSDDGETGIAEVRPEANAAAGAALHLERSGPGRLLLAQRVVPTFPVEGLIFRARARLSGAADGTAEGRGALILRYEDAAGAPLGASIWLDGSAEATDLWGAEPLPPLDSPVVARYLPAGWQAVELALGRELADELPGIDPVAVRQITVMLAVLGADDCAPAACAASLDISDLSLTTEAP